ncbi:MAG TPA: 23S rRNA (guanosine(2251)-2'-O)-methyltransferase RlmB [Gammaproteobacteria bacterium]
MSNTSRLYGLHAVQTVLTQSPERIVTLWLDTARQDQRLLQLAELAKKAKVAVTWSERKALDRLAEEGRHQGAVAELRGGEPRSEAFLEELLTTLQVPPFLLVLDGVTDPHNLGACLRTADAAGVHAVIAPRDRACGLNATVRKVASGAAETVPFVQVTNLARTLRMLRDNGVWVVGTALEGASGSLYQGRLTGPLALALGAEGQGLRRLTRENCDELVYIPMYGLVESLNVSVATGVALFEAVRQRTPNPSR